jgi:excisionase family DNA binding protein
MAPDAQSDAEVTVGEATQILGVSRDTVYRLIREGHLRCRKAGMPTSQRPTYRVLAEEVLQLRQRYERKTAPQFKPSQRKVTKRITANDLKFIRLAHHSKVP